MSSSLLPLHESANAFLATLNAEQRAKAVIAFDDEERLNWHFVPRARKGLWLQSMDERQKQAALALLQAGLSADGYKKAETIRSLERVLQTLENDPQGTFRNAEHYYVSDLRHARPQRRVGLALRGASHLAQLDHR
jgi:uncharacterized protein involved in exopolysaccharide biosynthesis